MCCFHLADEMAPKMKRSKLAKLVSEAEKTVIIPSILKDSRNEKTIVDAITEVNGLKLQVKGLESKVEKLKTDNASLQEEVVNLKKTNSDLEVANHEYEVKAAVNFAAGFAEAIAQVQVLAPGVDVSEAHYTKEIRDGQLFIASDEGDGDDEEDSGKKLVDVQDDQIHAVMKNSHLVVKMTSKLQEKNDNDKLKDWSMHIEGGALFYKDS
ncbi:hypothetical protein TSUD_114140 [Trifolium subterraneum]|uniref:Uncharacterized protein n=1 Tax=Trifolium subterraneum TaxID=3900 RepID=A0A2Z6M617_TRISU|nr:hypothetical protein TSUD_114140 [Trifolium subterraneum]